MQLSAHLIVAIVVFGVTMIAVMLANLFLYMMIGEINRKKAGSELVSYFGFWPGKLTRICREYRLLDPDGRLHTCFWTAVAVQLTAMLIFGVCFFTFHP